MSSYCEKIFEVASLSAGNNSHDKIKKKMFYVELNNSMNYKRDTGCTNNLKIF